MAELCAVAPDDPSDQNITELQVNFKRTLTGLFLLQPFLLLKLFGWLTFL